MLSLAAAGQTNTTICNYFIDIDDKETAQDLAQSVLTA